MPALCEPVGPDWDMVEGYFVYVCLTSLSHLGKFFRIFLLIFSVSFILPKALLHVQFYFSTILKQLVIY